MKESLSMGKSTNLGDANLVEVGGPVCERSLHQKRDALGTAWPMVCASSYSILLDAKNKKDDGDAVSPPAP